MVGTNIGDMITKIIFCSPKSKDRLGQIQTERVGRVRDDPKQAVRRSTGQYDIDNI